MKNTITELLRKQTVRCEACRKRIWKDDARRCEGCRCYICETCRTCDECAVQEYTERQAYCAYLDSRERCGIDHS